mmetsp:Transcript_69960/g.177553  ORF Transcript_69960/g.177553 Transcript_69960/m.177553 type:complete len:115 (-) Transcript_69960:516-860(-)
MKPTEMVIEVGEEDVALLVALSPVFRALLTLVVVVPKFLIPILLAIFGCTWLTAIESVSDLILNALAMAFIVEIDELIYDAFLPEVLKEELAELMTAIPQEDEVSATTKKNRIM